MSSDPFSPTRRDFKAKMVDYTVMCMFYHPVKQHHHSSKRETGIGGLLVKWCVHCKSVTLVGGGGRLESLNWKLSENICVHIFQATDSRVEWSTT